MTVEELAEKAGTVIREVATSGHRTVVTDNGRPVAAIVPLGEITLEADRILDLPGGYGAFSDLLPQGRSAEQELIDERRQEAARDADS